MSFVFKGEGESDAMMKTNNFQPLCLDLDLLFRFFIAVSVLQCVVGSVSVIVLPLLYCIDV